jgi:uncharacterized repeat protein (TIGR01451 family)
VDAGSPISFTVQVSVTGSGTANAVTLTDALPTGTGISWSIQGSVPECSITGGVLTCDFGNLTAPATRSVTVTSPSTPQSCGEYLNIASVQAANHGTVASNQASEFCPGRPARSAGSTSARISDYLFVFTDGRSDANWQSVVQGLRRQRGGQRAAGQGAHVGTFAYAGTIFTNDPRWARGRRSSTTTRRRRRGFLRDRPPGGPRGGAEGRDGGDQQPAGDARLREPLRDLAGR